MQSNRILCAFYASLAIVTYANAENFKPSYPYQWAVESRIKATDPIEEVTGGWKHFITENALSKSETIEAAIYFLHYAQEKKRTIEQEKALWSDRKYNPSRLKWGSI